MNHQDVTLIVREAGERTAQACGELLTQLFPGQPVMRVAAGTFPQTLRASLQAGIAAGRPWTLCVDADVLPLPGLKDFLTEAKSLPKHYGEAQALVADKLLPARRPAGNHLYRTALLPRALDLIPKRPALRPESAMIEAMTVAGFPYHQSECLVGLHDFEQWPLDLFNKAALHGHKHDYLASLILPLWRAWADHDPDYRVALAGFEAAQDSTPPQEVSRHWTRPRGETQLANMGLLHHQPLTRLDISTVEAMLSRAPHLRTEATRFRLRLEADLTALVQHQRRINLTTYPWWQRQWFRLTHRLPVLPCRSR